LACFFVGSQYGTACAARYVPIEVTVDGEVILKGNASDNGEPDADEVWEALKHVNLGETNAFMKLGIDPQAKEPTIEGNARKSVRINVRYGGVAETNTLVLRRMPPDSVGRVWRISSTDIDKLFLNRMVSRRDVVRLKDPKRETSRTR
jgi:hypothetical protein